MTDNIEIGDEIMSMPGSTFQRTWEVIDIEDGRVTLKLTDKAVGYVTDEETDTFDHDNLSEAVEDGVLTGSVVKSVPDMETHIIP